MCETSTKNCINVEEPFYDLVREIRKYNQIREEKSAIWESRRNLEGQRDLFSILKDLLVFQVLQKRIAQCLQLVASRGAKAER